MIAELSALVSSTKAAYDIANGIRSLKDEVVRNESISKILEVLVSVQFQASSVLASAHELEIEKHSLTKKIMEFENWSKTESQYDLKEVDTGTFVYVYNKTDNPSKPDHWLCPKCFQEKKTYILQLNYEGDTGSEYVCSNCKTIIKIRHGSSGSTPPRRGPGGPHSWMAR